MISTRPIGYDHIDVEVAKRIGFHISHVTYSPECVADYTLMLMLMCIRKMKRIMQREELNDFSLPGIRGRELHGFTVGVIGTGRIGQAVIRDLSGFGCRIYAYDLYRNAEVERYAEYVELKEIYETCDFITIHVPLMDSTKGMIDAKAIEKMKPGVILLNFARDLLANEKDVLEGLEAGKIRKYVSDFPNTTTAGHPGCIVIPHLGASTEESEDNCAKMAVDELMDYLANGNIKHSVNYPNCDMGVCATAGRIAILHKNIANMITQFTGALGEAGINITDLTNKSRGEYAYTLMDIESAADDNIIRKLKNIDGVFRVRVVK